MFCEGGVGVGEGLRALLVNAEWMARGFANSTIAMDFNCSNRLQG